MWSGPTSIVADSNSNLFVWDSGNLVIRKIGPDASVSTFAGGGTQFEGFGTNVAFSGQGFQYMTMDHSGTIWAIALYGSFYYLISISTNAEVELQNANISNLSLSSSLCVDSHNKIYYTGGNRIYKYDPITLSFQAFAVRATAANRTDKAYSVHSADWELWRLTKRIIFTCRTPV